MNNSHGFDAIVIGSGYGGACAAEPLSRAGLKVCIVERGTWWGAFDGHRPLPETVPQILRSLARFNLSAFGRGVSIPLSNRGLLEVSVHQGSIVVNSVAVGGNSLVSGNYMRRPAPQFFATLPPELTAAELAPYYERMEQVLEVSSGPRDEETQAKLSAFADREKCVLGPVPQSIHFESDDPVSKPPCTLCNKCMFGCNVGSKLSFDRTLIATAMKDGAVVRDLCTVQTVARVPGGYEVRFRDARTGKSEVLRALRVVVAAGAMNTLKILLRSTATAALDPIPGLGRHFSVGADWIAWYRVPRDITPKTVTGHVLEADMRVPGPGTDFDFNVLAATGPLIPRKLGAAYLPRAAHGRVGRFRPRRHGRRGELERRNDGDTSPEEGRAWTDPANARPPRWGVRLERDPAPARPEAARPAVAHLSSRRRLPDGHGCKPWRGRFQGRGLRPSRPVCRRRLDPSSHDDRWTAAEHLSPRILDLRADR
jgi:choline dehydrogenase-like flavoprotein